MPKYGRRWPVFDDDPVEKGTDEMTPHRKERTRQQEMDHVDE